MVIDPKIEGVEKQNIDESAGRWLGIENFVSILFSHEIEGLNFGYFVMIGIFYFRLCLVYMGQRGVQGKSNGSNEKSFEVLKMCV